MNPNPNSISDSLWALSIESTAQTAANSSHSSSSWSMSAQSAMSSLTDDLPRESLSFLSGVKRAATEGEGPAKRTRTNPTRNNADYSESEGESKPTAVSTGAKAHIDRLKQHIHSTEFQTDESAAISAQHLNQAIQSHQSIELAWRAIEPRLVQEASLLADQHPGLVNYCRVGSHQFSNHREVWAQQLLCDLIESPRIYGFNQTPNPRVMNPRDLSHARLSIKNAIPSLEPTAIDRLTCRLALRMGASHEASGTFQPTANHGIFHVEPLFLAQLNDRADLINALVMEGADIHMRSNCEPHQNQTLLEYAQMKGADVEYLNFLRELGA